MPDNTHHHQGESPKNDPQIAIAEKERCDRKGYDHKQTPQRDITKCCDQRDGTGNTEERRDRKTVQHDAAGRCNSLAAFETKEYGPVVADYAAKSGRQCSHMIARQQLRDEAGKDSFECIGKKGDQAVFPAHGPLDIARTRILAADCPQIRAFGKFRNKDAG